jgi:hypothetical protein
MQADMHGIVAKISAIVSAIPELQLLVTPDAAIVPMTTTASAGFTIYQVASLLEQKGWNMFTGQHPAVMSCCIGEQHLHVLGEWEADLHAAVATLRENPGLKLRAMRRCTARPRPFQMSCWTRACARTSIFGCR